MFGHALLCLLNDGSLMFTRDVSRPKENPRLLLADFATNVSQNVVKLKLFRIENEYHCALVENLDPAVTVNEDKLTYFKLNVENELKVTQLASYRVPKVVALSVNASIRYGPHAVQNKVEEEKK